MTKLKSKVFAIHPGEILRTEFMEPLGVSAYALAKALDFPGLYEVVRGDVPSALTRPSAWESISACPRNSGSTCRMITICGLQRPAVSARKSSREQQLRCEAKLAQDWPPHGNGEYVACNPRLPTAVFDGHTRGQVRAVSDFATHV